MLCALLVFDGPDFPQPLERLSPWLDMLNRPIDEVRATYAAQDHRRFIKTHTPLDGLPRRDDVTYIVVGRDPRDVAISMEHHMDNMDIDRFVELRARAVGLDDLAELPPRHPLSEDPSERFRAFVEKAELGGPATLTSVLHHLHTGWERRSAPNIALFHYADYRADLPGELLRLAAAPVSTSPRRGPPNLPPKPVSAACENGPPKSYQRLTRHAAQHVGLPASRRIRRTAEPGHRNRHGVLRPTSRVARPPPDLAAWAHLGRLQSGIDPT